MNRTRKAIAFIMILAMIFCYAPPTAFASQGIEGEPEFVDMPREGFWSTAALEAAVNNGLLKGVENSEGTFIKPNDTLTRAQMATIVNRAFGAVEKAALNGVADVSSKAWYYSDMGKAVKMGTMKIDTKMRPNDPVTRQEAFTVLARAIRATGGNSSDIEKFQDKDSLASWAIDGVGALIKQGYVQGSDGKLTPKAEITRAQFAVIMNNVIKQYIGTPSTVTEVVAQGNVMINVPGTTLKDLTINGDLIIGDGVGDGNVTLDNVRVTGDIIARGGGIDSIVIKGGNVDGKIVISKVDGKIRVFLEGGAEAEVIVIDDGKDDVVIEGNVGTLEVNASNVPIIVRNGSIKEIEIKAEASNTQIGVEEGSSVTNITVKGQGTNISGEGEVKTTKIVGNNTTVNTKNTTVNVDAGVTGVILNGESKEDSEEPYEETTGEEEPVIAGSGDGAPGPGTVTPALTATTEVISPTQVAVTITSQEGLTFNFDGDIISGSALLYDSGVFKLEVIEMAPGTEYPLFVSKTGYTNYTKNDVKWEIEYTQTTEAVSPASINVPYETAFGQAADGLDKEISIQGTFAGVNYNGEATITWSSSSYDATSAGAYTATGTLTLPSGWTGNGTVTATVNVSPAAYASTAVLGVTSVNVTYGTISSDAILLLDPSVVVTEESGLTGTAIISWVIASYDSTSEGAYTATGTLTLPNSWTGSPLTVNATVIVSPAAYASTDPLTTTSVAVTYGATSMEALGLLQSTVPTVGVNGTNSETGTATITWTTIPGYNGTSPGAYQASGSLTLPNSWSGDPTTVTASVIVLGNNVDQSGFDLIVMPGSPTIEGIVFPLEITNAALADGSLLEGANWVEVTCNLPYLGTNDETVINGEDGELTSFSAIVNFTSGGGALPIFISTPGNFTLTVSVAGITTNQSIMVNIAESQADIAYEVPVIYHGSTTPAYITVTSITDASGGSRNEAFNNDDGSNFELGIIFAPSDEFVPNAVTKSEGSMLIEIPNPALLTTRGAYIITIDMEDGNWWDIPIEVTSAGVGYTPDSLDVDVEFGSIIVDMIIKDGEDILTWGAIADTVDMADSTITLRNVEGDENRIVITFGGLRDRLDDVANTITFDGNTGLGGSRTSDFAIGGILGDFEAFGHNTVDVELIATDESWHITATAIIPYLEVATTPGAMAEGSMDLEVNYQQGQLSLIELNLSSVNILDAIQTDYETAYNNKVTIAGINGGSNLYAYAEIARPEANLENLSTMVMNYNSDTNRFTLSGTRTENQDVEAVVSLFFYDCDTGTVGNTIIEIFAEGAGNSVEFAHFPMIDEVYDSGVDASTVTVSFDSDMDQDSVVDISNYMYSQNGVSVTIEGISYDSNTNEATITIDGIVAMGDMIIISSGGGITENNGYELQETMFMREESAWSTPGEGPASDPIALYENVDMTSPSSVFELDSMVYVLIDNPEGLSSPGAVIGYHASSSIDGQGITFAAIDDNGDNFFGNGFLISSNPSTTNGGYNLETTIGGIITISYGADFVTAMAIASGGGGPEARVPDGMDINVDFGSLLFNITPTSGGEPLSMSAIGLNTSTSILELRDTTQPESPVYASFGAISNDEHGTLDQNNNQITLDGEYIDLARNDIFSTSPRALFADFYYDEDEIVFITLAGTVNGNSYVITGQAIIPWLGLENATQSGLSLVYALENNYEIEISDGSGHYNQVSLFGVEVNPSCEDEALTAIDSVTRRAIGDVDGNEGRIKAYYIGEQTGSMEGGPSYSLDNIAEILIDFDPVAGTITVSATKITSATSVSALIHLFIEDSVQGNRSFESFEVSSEAGSEAVEVREMVDNMLGSVNLSADASEVSWSTVDDASGYILKLYKDFETTPEAIYTTNVGIEGSSLHIGQTIYDLRAGSGYYSAKVEIVGGSSSGKAIDSGETVYITQMEEVTGVRIDEGVLFWDNLSQNNQGVEIQISTGGTIYTTIGSTNNGDSGYDLIENSVLNQGSGPYEIGVMAAGSNYNVIPSQNPTVIEVTENGGPPTAKAEGSFTGHDNEQPNFVDANGYTSGDAFKLNFSEPIDFASLDITDFSLDGASDWGTTSTSDITFNDKSPTLFDKYNDSIVIFLKDGSLIASGSKITLAEGATTDILGNTNGSIVFNVDIPDQGSSPESSTASNYDELVTALGDLGTPTIRLIQDITNEAITISRPVTLELNGYTLGGNVFVTTSAVGEIKFTSPGTIGGDLTIDAPNATITNEATVSGTAIINGVSYSSYLAYYPHLGGIRMNGPGRVNLQSTASNSLVEVNTSNMVILDGQINQVSIITPNALARVQGTINQIAVNDGANGATVELLGGSNVSNINATGSAQVYRADSAGTPDLTGPNTPQLNTAYKVTFDKNGGDTEAKPSYLLWDNNEATSNRIPSEPDRTAYNFAGWNTSQNGTVNEVNESTKVSAATTFYAIWNQGDIEITGYKPLDPIDAGEVGSVHGAYSTSESAINSLNGTYTQVEIVDAYGFVAINNWEAPLNYTSAAAGSYTFTATVGDIPAGFVDAEAAISHVTVEVIIREVVPPQIDSVVAQEGKPDEGPFEEGIGEGDTLSITFKKNTNQVGDRTMAEINQMFTFSSGSSLGTSYSGAWFNSSKFIIDIHDGSGATLLVGDTITINESAGIKSEDGQSASCTESSVIVGSFDPEGLYGSVLKSTGDNSPISGIDVKVYNGSTLSGIGTTDSNGDYYINVGSGSYRLEIYEDYYYLSENKTVSAPGNVQTIYLQEASKITATLNVVLGSIPDGYRLIWQMTNFDNYNTRNISELNLEIPGIPVDQDHWLHFTLVDEDGYEHLTSCAAVSLTQGELTNEATLYTDGNSSYINISNSLSFKNTVDIGTIKLEIKAINE